MIRPSLRLFLDALVDPRIVCTATPVQQEALLRVGRGTDLLARLAERVHKAGLLPSIAEPLRMHLESARILVLRQHRELEWELSELHTALSAVGLSVVLLKGAAYVKAGLDAAVGRAISDVDLIVPLEQLGVAESALMLRGWMSTKRSEYDQRYYREWMHELPPMQHVRRRTTVDLHHAILPRTARLQPSSAALLGAVVACGQEASLSPRYWMLAPVDMFLHSATHLFHEGEFHHGLRGLVDLDSLAREFSNRPDFWPRLAKRARELQLGRPALYALTACRSILATPVPAAILDALASDKHSLLRRSTAALMDWAIPRVMVPDHPLTRPDGATWARAGMYLRSHWLRMPPAQLVRHLSYKCWLALSSSRQAPGH